MNIGKVLSVIGGFIVLFVLVALACGARIVNRLSVCMPVGQAASEGQITVGGDNLIYAPAGFSQTDLYKSMSGMLHKRGFALDGREKFKLAPQCGHAGTLVARYEQSLQNQYSSARRPVPVLTYSLTLAAVLGGVGAFIFMLRRWRFAEASHH